MELLKKVRHKVERACRHLLSEQNRDRYTPTYGCFDRRYWGWKLVDYPEATFQRNVYPLAWLLGQAEQHSIGTASTLQEAVVAGLGFAVNIQHKDGSFDQAFPNERSFGATAFLLHPLLAGYRVVQEVMTPSQRAACERCLRQGANFLCRHDETHGHIANHLAGAVFSLLTCAEFFDESRYERRAEFLLQRILNHQSNEGWFLEYEGADPGYQTLCIHYLAQVYQMKPDERLLKALTKAVNFLSWFVNPDGTFAGEYGSRRTAVYYPGGLALLQSIPMALSITQHMVWSIAEENTVTIDDVDVGNVAPLLSSYILLLDTLKANETNLNLAVPPLPWQEENACQDFAEAGLYVRSSKRYYAVTGASNGGVLKIFDRDQRRLLLDDGGYVGESEDGSKVTTQITDLKRKCLATHKHIQIEVPFYRMPQTVLTPAQFVLLRILNLTIMHSVWLGNQVKALLVRRLISGKRRVPLNLVRTLIFEREHVVIQDQLTIQSQFSLRWLECGRPFVAIHMASSRYFQGFSVSDQRGQPHTVDVLSLKTRGIVQSQITV